MSSQTNEARSSHSDYQVPAESSNSSSFGWSELLGSNSYSQFDSSSGATGGVGQSQQQQQQQLSSQPQQHSESSRYDYYNQNEHRNPSVSSTYSNSSTSSNSLPFFKTWIQPLRFLAIPNLKSLIC